MDDQHPSGNPQTTGALNPEEEKKLNQPLKKASLSQEDESFLMDLVAKAERGAINFYQPTTLINQAIYDKLTPEQQGKVDFDAVNLVNQLRNIYELWKATKQPTFQIENMVHAVRLLKERLENISGDVYIV